MRRRELSIINFLYLEEEKYNKIREYRNQQYIVNVSSNTNLITEEEHHNYFKLLKEKDTYFAFLIRRNNEDYGVVTLKKITDDTYYIGDYLVKEEYKFEGGGVVNRICISYLANKLNIKYFKTMQYKGNLRGNRSGGVKTIEIVSLQDGFNEITSIVDYYYDKNIVDSKPRKLFDKLYVIKECQI